MAASAIGEYLDYKNCVCKNSIVDKLVEEYTNVIDGGKFYNKALSVTPSNIILSDDCASCTLCCIICSIFNNKRNNWWCFCLFLLVFKKRYCPNVFKKEC